MKKKTALIFSLLFTAVLFTAGCGAASADVQNASSPAAVSLQDTSSGTMRDTVTVNGSEEVSVVPDIAELVYAVRTESKTASECQQKNAESVSQVTELLKGLGIAETSIRTSGYNMYPRYDYSGKTEKLTGYEATATLTISDLPIADVSNVLSQSVSSGVTHIESISYQVSNYDECYQEALKLAMDTARRKAEAMAEAGGRSLAGVVNIVEESQYSQARYTDNALTSKMQAARDIAGTEENLNDAVMPGELSIEAQITVQYQLQ